ncbi:esterase [Oxalobacter sp. OttesenSCG-928-P03]|nr:esterase [Oxalobacter sp. OttesenSCG-928-P03]
MATIKKTDTSEQSGRLSFRITPPAKKPLLAGEYRLSLTEERDTLLIVPRGLTLEKPVPLFVMFHGARQSAKNVIPFLADHARRRRFLLLMPQSTGPTWDICMGGYGPDVSRLEKALRRISEHFAIDPAHLAFAGFSDGGSYALSLGLTNGDLVSHVIGFSAGFMKVKKETGSPPVFLSHSPEDERLDISRCSASIYDELKKKGGDVVFHTFSGGHVIHPPIVEKAMAFFLK